MDDNIRVVLYLVLLLGSLVLGIVLGVVSQGNDDNPELYEMLGYEHPIEKIFNNKNNCSESCFSSNGFVYYNDACLCMEVSNGMIRGVSPDET